MSAHFSKKGRENFVISASRKGTKRIALCLDNSYFLEVVLGVPYFYFVSLLGALLTVHLLEINPLSQRKFTIK